MTLLTAGADCEVGAYAGYLCIPDRWSGGGSWNCGRLDAADLRAVKLCPVSIMEYYCKVHGDGEILRREDSCRSRVEGKERLGPNKGSFFSSRLFGLSIRVFFVNWV